MRNLDELGFEHLLYDDAKAPPPLSGVAEFEEAFQTKLPPDYLAFLNFSNGGRVERSSFGHPRYSAVSAFFSLTTDTDDIYGVWENTRLMREALADESEFLAEGDDDVIYIPPLALYSPDRESLRLIENFSMNPIACGMDGSGNFLIIDQSRGGRVYYVARDEGKMVKRADDFGVFIDGLYGDDDDIEVSEGL
jgi:hypothetical protein